MQTIIAFLNKFDLDINFNGPWPIVFAGIIGVAIFAVFMTIFLGFAFSGTAVATFWGILGALIFYTLSTPAMAYMDWDIFDENDWGSWTFWIGTVITIGFFFRMLYIVIAEDNAAGYIPLPSIVFFLTVWLIAFALWLFQNSKRLFSDTSNRQK